MNLSGKNNEKNLQISAYYGGTFDPLHNGHLSIIKNITESLLIRKVFLVPTGNPYMKRFSPIATPFQRLAMCKIGVTNKSVQIVDYEVNRPNPSYTIDTLDFLKKTQKDSCIKYIVLGSDAFNELHLWKDYIQLVKSYHFIVIKRIGNKLNKPTKREYYFMQDEDAADGMEYTVFYTVDRYTGELTAHVSEKWLKSEAGSTEALRKAFIFRETLKS